MWTVNFGQIYTSLKALVSEGCVVLTDVVPSESGAPHKKLYSLTDKGRKDFQKWLKSSPEKPVLLRDPFMTRFIFFEFGEKEDALQLIDEQIKRAERSLANRMKTMASRKSSGFYSAMARRLGILRIEVYVKWLHKVREQLPKQNFKRKRGPEK
jgi:DNA-binding PadR family transcriptional regulator